MTRPLPITKNRPFLKWAGNKYRYLERIHAILPDSTRLIEPFAGSAALFMNSNYPSYLLAEENIDLINLYQHIKQEGDQFIQFCAQYFTDQYNNPTNYYQFRDRFNQTSKTRLQAALFLYLNRHGYNGLCRYNHSGGFNVPFGRYKKPYFPFREMQHFHQKSVDAQFLHADFRETFKQAKSGDVIYCDPPYVPLSVSASFAAYTNKGFNETDQLDLAKLALEYSTKGITTIISNHDTAFTREHYQSAQIYSFPVKRTISCKGQQRNNVQELLAVFVAK